MSEVHVMEGSSVATVLLAPPLRMARILSETSFTSAALSFMYASSMEENIMAKLSLVVATAYSALTSWVSIILWMESR